MFHGHLDYFQWPPLGGRPTTKPGDHGTPNAHNRCFILFYHVWWLTWIEVHWSSIWLGARSHRTSHYTWGSMTTLHDFRGVLGQSLDFFFWAPTIPWSRLLALSWRKTHFARTNEWGRSRWDLCILTNILGASHDSANFMIYNVVM